MKRTERGWEEDGKRKEGKTREEDETGEEDGETF